MSTKLSGLTVVKLEDLKFLRPSQASEIMAEILPGDDYQSEEVLESQAKGKPIVSDRYLSSEIPGSLRSKEINAIGIVSATDFRTAEQVRSDLILVKALCPNGHTTSLPSYMFNSSNVGYGRKIETVPLCFCGLAYTKV